MSSWLYFDVILKLYRCHIDVMLMWSWS